jgi:iron complex outermembrane receptor protein
MLKSSMDLGPDLTLDAQWRWVGELPEPRTPAYHELDVRLGWRVSESLEVAVRGQNLLHPRHREFAAPDGEQLERSAYAELRWAY